MTTPTGRPAWVRTVDFSDYGGSTEKANFQGQTIVNPRTDVGAAGFSRLVADASAVVRTAEFASMQIQCDDSGPTSQPSVLYCQMMVGTTSISYMGTAPPGGVTPPPPPGGSPPAGLPLLFPTAKRNGNGDVTITFPASQNDEYGVAGAFIAKEPIANFVGAGGGVAVPELVSATEIRVRVFDLSNAAISNARFTLSIGSGT